MSYLKERWEVGVWSSATPENVDRMLTFLGMREGQETSKKKIEGEGTEKVEKRKNEMKLRVVWARDTLGLSDAEYSESSSCPFCVASLSSSHTRPLTDSKSVTIKDLDVIFNYLNSPKSLPPTTQKGRSSRPLTKLEPYSPLNTFLLDDSHIKTSNQPFNHLPVPDYDSVLSTASAKFYRAAEEAKNAPPPAPVVPNPDEISLDDDDDDVEPSTLPTPAKELVKEVESVGVDRSLLAVVGILERARGEESLVGWVRSGGLIPDLDDPKGWWLDVDDGPSASASTSTSTSVKSNTKKNPRPKIKKSKKNRDDASNLSLIFPPSSSSTATITSSIGSATSLKVSAATPWYSSPPHVEFWVRRGVDVLEGMKIDLSHGLDLSFLDSMPGEGRGRRGGSKPPTSSPAEGREARRGSRPPVEAVEGTGGGRGGGSAEASTAVEEMGGEMWRPPRKIRGPRRPSKMKGKEGSGGTKVDEGDEEEERKVERELMGDSSF